MDGHLGFIEFNAGFAKRNVESNNCNVRPQTLIKGSFCNVYLNQLDYVKN